MAWQGMARHGMAWHGMAEDNIITVYAAHVCYPDPQEKLTRRNAKQILMIFLRAIRAP